MQSRKLLADPAAYPATANIDSEVPIVTDQVQPDQVAPTTVGASELATPSGITTGAFPGIPTEVLLSEANARLAELANRGVDVVASIGDEEENQPNHWFPKYNPCAEESTEYLAKKTRAGWRAVFLFLAPKCQCCAGARIFILLVFFLIALIAALAAPAGA